MTYPHVRVSAGDPGGPNRRFFNQRAAARLYPDAEDYAVAAQAMGWERFETTGWVRTRGRAPVRIHESDDLVLLAGGWTRVRADDSPIVSNRVLYTLTQIEGGWGIQARFGVDSHLADTDQGPAAAGLDCASRMLRALQAGDRDDWLGCFGFPLTLVRGPGRVEVLEDPDQLRNLYSDWIAVANRAGCPAEVIATGATGVLVVQPTGAGPADRSIGALIAARNGQWRAIAVTGRF